MLLFPAAWTRGIATPARADAAAILPVFLMNSRREVRLWGFSFIGHIFWTARNKCQFKKFPQAFARCGEITITTLHLLTSVATGYRDFMRSMKYSRYPFAATTGRVKTKIAPRPGSRRTTILPW